MTYSCVDFTDDILKALNIEVPERSWDNPYDQANLSLGAIYRLKAIETAAKSLLERWGEGNLTEAIQALNEACKPLEHDEGEAGDGDETETSSS